MKPLRVVAALLLGFGAVIAFRRINLSVVRSVCLLLCMGCILTCVPFFWYVMKTARKEK